MGVIEIEYQQKGVDGNGNEIHYFPKTKGGGSGPESYIKTAAVNTGSDTLTLTDQNDTQVVFKPTLTYKEHQLNTNLYLVNNLKFYDDDSYSLYYNLIRLSYNAFLDVIDLSKPCYLMMGDERVNFVSQILVDSYYYFLFFDQKGRSLNTLISNGAKLCYVEQQV